MTMQVIILNDDTDDTRQLSVTDTDTANPGVASETVIKAGTHKTFTIWDTKSLHASEVKV